MARWLIVCLLGLAATACGGSSAAKTPAAASGGAAQALTFKEAEYSISPATVTTKAGTYTITVQNAGQFPHDLHIANADGSELGASTVVQANQSTTFTVTLKPGTYTIWCAVDAHRSLGMQASMNVQ
jgi:plastocyanin